MLQNLYRRRILALALFLGVQLFLAVVLGGAVSAAEEPWKFAVLCDTRGDSNPANLYKSGVNSEVVSRIAQDIVSQGAELVIVPGDLVNGWYTIRTPYASQFATWRQAMAPVYEAGIKVYPVRGNHEDGPFVGNVRYPWPPSDINPQTAPIAELKAAYLAAFNDPWIPRNGPPGEEGLTYSFSHKNAFFIGLDEYVNPMKVNQPWLDSQLKANNLPHVFVYGHVPAFRVSHTDSLASYPKERDAFWNSLGNAGVRIYFCGHDHFYNRAHVEDAAGHIVYQVIVGSCGAPFHKLSFTDYPEGDKVVNDYHDGVHYGYALVTVDGPRVTMEWRALVTEKGTNVWKTMDVMDYTVN